MPGGGPGAPSPGMDPSEWAGWGDNSRKNSQRRHKHRLPAEVGRPGGPGLGCCAVSSGCPSRWELLSVPGAVLEPSTYPEQTSKSAPGWSRVSEGFCNEKRQRGIRAEAGSGGGATVSSREARPGWGDICEKS